MKNQTPSNDVMERFKNLPPEIQATYVSAERIEWTEEALYKASIEMNEREDEIDSLPRMEAHKLRQKIMRKYLDEMYKEFHLIEKERKK